MRHRSILLSVLSFFAVSAAHAQATSFTGFVNPTFTMSSENDNGFAVNDAALYLTHTNGKASLFLDLPFYSDSNDDSTGTFAFAETKAQANVAYQLNESVKFVLGQFDTIYGFELNDAKDRFFQKTGIVYDKALNVTHTGLLVEGKVAGVTLRAVVANQNNADNVNGATQVEEEAGVQASYNFTANTYLTAGYLTYTPDGLEDDTTLLDVIVGTKLGAWALDAEYVQKDDGADNDPSFILLHAAYNVNDKHRIGARIEMGTDNDYDSNGDDAGGEITDEDNTQYAVAYRYIENANFYIQAEAQVLTADNDNQNEDIEDGDTQIRLGGVYTF